MAPPEKVSESNIHVTMTSTIRKIEEKVNSTVIQSCKLENNSLSGIAFIA